MEPTLNSLKDINDALQVWSQYWPVLLVDETALELEEKIAKKIEFRKHIFGSKNFENISYDSSTELFTKLHHHKSEIKFWSFIKSLQDLDKESKIF